MFHANPGHGTDGENKSPPDGRGGAHKQSVIAGGSALCLMGLFCREIACGDSERDGAQVGFSLFFCDFQ